MASKTTTDKSAFTAKAGTMDKSMKPAQAGIKLCAPCAKCLIGLGVIMAAAWYAKKKSYISPKTMYIIWALGGGAFAVKYYFKVKKVNCGKTAGNNSVSDSEIDAAIAELLGDLPAKDNKALADRMSGVGKIIKTTFSEKEKEMFLDYTDFFDESMRQYSKDNNPELAEIGSMGDILASVDAKLTAKYGSEDTEAFMAKANKITA